MDSSTNKAQGACAVNDAVGAATELTQEQIDQILSEALLVFAERGRALREGRSGALNEQGQDTNSPCR